ncbi:MAG TPA: amino acid permease [Candidatus Kryptonia bacterium]
MRLGIGMEEKQTIVTTAGRDFRKTITLRHAVALYVSSVLGSGVLVLPGLAAKIAGPSSLIAWVLLSLASYPFAYTFASLSSRKPEAGGVYSFAKESFGPHVATLVGWLFALWYITGGPAVVLIAASYLIFAFPLGRASVYLIATLVITVPFFVNLRGIKFSNRLQVAVMVSIVALLLAAVAASAGHVRPENFVPFIPNGIAPIGTAAALIFWSYLGYENVSNVAEEFRDPERDFRRSITLSVIIIGILYISVAAVTVGTLAYEAAGSVAPFAAIFSNVLGSFGTVGTALLAVFIIFGTANAYTSGMSRVIYATARDGGLPKQICHLNSRGVPDRSLLLLFGSSILVLVIYYFFDVNLEVALLIPSGGAIVVYIIGSMSGIKLLSVRGVRRTFPWMALIMSIIVLPFVGIWIIGALGVAVLSLSYSLIFNRANAPEAEEEVTK